MMRSRSLTEAAKSTALTGGPEHSSATEDNQFGGFSRPAPVPCHARARAGTPPRRSLSRLRREKSMRRSAILSDDAGYGPRTMLLGELFAARVPCKGVQLLPGLRLKNVDAHGSVLSPTLSSLRRLQFAHSSRDQCSNLFCMPPAPTSKASVCPPYSAASELAASRRSASRACTLVLVAEDQAALFEIVGRHLDGDAIAR